MKTNISLTIALVLITFITSAQWQQTSCPNTGRTTCFAISGANIFAGMKTEGVYLSTNDGGSWTAVQTGLTYPGVRALAISGTNIFAGTDGGGVFLSTNNGANWATLNTGLTNTDVRALMASSPYLNAGTNGGGNFASSDNGLNWAAMNTGLTDLRISSIAGIGIVGPFVGTPSGVFMLNYPTWSAVNNGLTNLDVFVLASSGTTLFAGTQGGGIFKTTNNGANWVAANSGLTFSFVTSFAFSGSNIFAGTNGGGIFRSTNNGASWTAINTGLTTLDIYSIAVNGSYIYAGTDVNGIWRRPLTEVTGIKETNDNNNKVSIYPNPTSEKLSVTFEKNIGQQIQANIFNTFGQQIFTQNISDNDGTATLDFSNFSEGIYFLSLVTDNQPLCHKKIIVAR